MSGTISVIMINSTEEQLNSEINWMTGMKLNIINIQRRQKDLVQSVY